MNSPLLKIRPAPSYSLVIEPRHVLEPIRLPVEVLTIPVTETITDVPEQLTLRNRKDGK